MERIYQYWLLRNQDMTNAKKAKLMEYFYDSYGIFNATKKDLLNSHLLEEHTIDAFIEHRKKFDLNKEYEDFLHSPFSFVTLEDDNYPEKLRMIFDKPYGLYYVGKLPDFSKTVSIVGARRCSAYGKRMAMEIGEKLGENEFTVISGMARGIDAYGHRGCIDGGGSTIAVLGCGCDVIYPRENRLLYEEILATGGAVISEFQMGTEPIAMYFPMRNRIVSALSDAVVVVEAREKSGSLITADLALDQGKDIYVTPGRIGDSLSTGCNKLISQGAGVIYNTDAFVKELLEYYGETTITKSKRKEKIKLTEEQKKVYKLFDDYPKSIATVLEESRMDYLQLLSVVLSLERHGLLAEVFKNNYVITV